MDRPWTALPRSFAVELRKEQTTLTAEIISEVRKQVPEFSRPLSGNFGAGIRYGVETALAGFADLVEGTAQNGDERLRVYRALGRGEADEGRSLDALQAAFRTGARVAWRRYARAARRSGLGPDLVVVVAEAIFTHIDEMASASVRGYGEAKAGEAGAFGRRRRALLQLLVSGAAADDLARAAAETDWRLPALVACVALAPDDPGAGRAAEARTRSLRRLPEPVLAAPDDPAPFLLLPDPEQLLTDPHVRAALADRGAVVGPTVPVGLAADSLRWARAARAAALRGGVPAAAHSPTPVAVPVLLTFDDRLSELLLLGDPSLVRLMAARRLGPLTPLTPKQSERLGATLLAWLQTNRGTAPEVAARLGIHPQTARQRLHRVQQLFGPALSDPDARFELEVALRGRFLAAGP